jgi:hypothetical protein
VVHLRFAVLVFVLSGMPASAVLCDLVLCSPTPRAAEGCHEHDASSSSGPAVSPADSCSHLAAVAPFLVAAERDSAGRAVPPAAAEGPRAPDRPGAPVHPSPTANRFPRIGASGRFLPLRI